MKNYDNIQDHNEKFEAGQTLFQKGVNKFSDLTKEEFDARYHTAMLGKPVAKKSTKPIVSQPNKLLSPKFWDWFNPWSKKDDDDVDDDQPASSTP